MATFGHVLATAVKDDVIQNVRYGIDSLAEKKDRGGVGRIQDIAEGYGNGIMVDGRFAVNPKHTNHIGIASTGVGKTVTGILPQLLNGIPGSVIVHDSSGQVYNLVSGFYHRLGYEIHRINYSNIKNSTSINYLDLCDSDEEFNQLGHHFMRVTQDGPSSDKFFITSGAAMISFCMRFCKEAPVPFRNMENVLHVCRALGTKGRLDRVMSKWASPKVFEEYKNYRGAGSEKTLSSIQMSALAALEVFGSDALCRATANSSISFASFKQRKQILFIETSTYASEYFRHLTSITLELAMKELMKDVSNATLPIYNVIDEASTLNLPSLSQLISNSRKYNIYNILYYQNIQQIFHAYGKELAENIISNSSQAYFGYTAPHTSREIAELGGKRDKKGKDGKVRSEYVISPERISRMNRSQGMLVLRNKVYPLSLVPWYENMRFKMRAQLPPYAFSNTLIHAKADLMPLT